MAESSYTSVLQVGIDSYVSLDDANTYVNKYYLDTDVEYIVWNKTKPENRDKILLRSAGAINCLEPRLKGRRKVPGQNLVFPRSSTTSFGFYYAPFYSQMYDAELERRGSNVKDGWDAAGRAQIVNAVAGLIYGGKNVIAAKQRSLSGLRSKSSDDVSETYETPTDNARYAMQGIYDIEAVKKELVYWMTNSIQTQ